MSRSRIRLIIGFYVSVSCFFVINYVISTYHSNPNYNRCRGNNAESCLIEENRRSFGILTEITAVSSRKEEISNGKTQGFDTHKNYSNSLQFGDYSTPRPFPPLYQPLLSNGLNCTKLWHGDNTEVRRAQQQLNATKEARRPAGFYEEIRQNCAEYRQQNGFIEDISPKEREFPLAFSLLVYKDVEQVERLLRAVYRPHNVYCVHIDTKTKPHVLQDLRSLIHCLPNVVESPKRVNVVWGTFSVLEPELICMQRLWSMRTRWKYLINLTGQEFPLKTNWELVKILRRYREANDVFGEKPKLEYMWRWKKSSRPPPLNITVAKGPVHVAASRGFVDFLLHSEQAQAFLGWTKLTEIPDETFFSTLNNQHQFRVPGSYTGNLTSKRRIMWNRFKLWDFSNRPCSGKYVRHICHFGPEEVAILTHTRHFVANKFSYELHPLAYDCTEQWYFDRVRRERERGDVDPTLPLKYYENLEIVKHAYRGENGAWEDLV